MSEKPATGTKVHYIPFQGADKSQYENGIVKSHHPNYANKVFVVYHWDGESSDYRDYTAALTDISQLREGWI